MQNEKQAKKTLTNKKIFICQKNWHKSQSCLHSSKEFENINIFFLSKNADKIKKKGNLIKVVM